MTKINDSVSVGAELAARITRMNEMLMLTDAERLAIRRAAAVADEFHDARLAATLRGLLERTK